MKLEEIRKRVRMHSKMENESKFTQTEKDRAFLMSIVDKMLIHGWPKCLNGGKLGKDNCPICWWNRVIKSEERLWEDTAEI